MKGRQALAFGLIVVPAAALYLASADWLIGALLGLTAVGMLLGLRGEGDK
jgi:hypothetical protein